MKELKFSTGQTLANRAVILTVSRITSSVSIILLFILLSRLLSAVDYGSFRQVWLINKNLMEVFGFGIPVSIMYFLPRLEDNQKKIFVVQSILLLSFMGFLFAFLVFLFAGKIALLFNNSDLKFLLRSFCLYPLFVLPTAGTESILASLEKTEYYAIFFIIDKILMLIVVGISVLFFQSLLTLFLILIIFAFIELSASICLIYYFTKSFKILSIKFGFAKQFKFALPSGMARIVGIASQEIDKLMIASFFSVVQFAKYANGAFEIPFVGSIAASITTVLMPEYVKRHQQQDYRSLLELWHGAIHKVAIFLIPLMVFLFIFASDFITILFSEKYKESSLVFQIYLIALMPKVTWYGPILVSMGYNKEPFYGSLVALSSNIILNYLFIKWIGFTGPAIATVLTTYILTGYYLMRICGATNVSLWEVFPWKLLFSVLTVSLVLGVVVWPITFYDSMSNIVRLSLGTIIFFIPVIICLRWIKLISDDDIDFIFGYLKGVRQIILSNVKHEK